MISIFIFAIWILVIFLGPFYQKSKIIKMVIIVVAFILYGWSYGNADYINYEQRYNNYDSIMYRRGQELGYMFLEKCFNSFGVNYRGFLIASSIMIMLSIIIFLKLIKCNNPNYILSMYLVFPLCMNIVTMRFALASSFALIAIGFLLSDIKKKYIYSLIFILLSITIHVSCVWFLILICVEKCGIKKAGYIINGIFTSLLALALLPTLLERIIVKLPDNSLSRVIRITLNVASNKYDIIDIAVVVVQITITYMLCLCCFKLIKKINTFEVNKSPIIDRCFLYSKATLTLIPLSIITGDVFRIQMIMLIVLYAAIARCFCITNQGYNGIMRGISLKIAFCGFLTAFSMLFFWVLRSQNLYVVFLPMFRDNVLF